ncbi:MAG: 5-(carboxyamino)imidazole ribonucleotide synthase [Bosea sp. (in: a-proteobacteria)]
MMAAAVPFAGRVLVPGDTIGILGGGQLGRMLALAAAQLGLRCHIFAPEADSPAFDVSAARTVATYDDMAALRRFASEVAAVTYEFENVPVEAVEFLETLVPVRPGSKALGVAQDRLAEKHLARSLGAPTADFAAVNSPAELHAAVTIVGTPAVLKTLRFGYDGKGQAKIMQPEDADAAYAAINRQPAILERFVHFTTELSVVAARGIDGAFVPFDVTENEHRNHILHRSVAPARLKAAAATVAVETTRKIAEALDYVGVIGVEFFATGDSLHVNEIAPRVHNSGHWTMDGALTSQFEQHMRAVAGWPLGSARRLAPEVEMLNLIGCEADGWQSIISDPAARLHLYGKADARPGRKMGHVNRLLGLQQT